MDIYEDCCSKNFARRMLFRASRKRCQTIEGTVHINNDIKTRCRTNGTWHDWPAVAFCPWWVTMRRRGVLQTTDDDDRRKRAKQYWSPYTMCRRASNK